MAVAWPMMPLSDMLAILVTSLLRLLGAAIVVLFGLGYIGQITGQRWLSAPAVLWSARVLGIGIALGSSYLVKAFFGG